MAESYSIIIPAYNEERLLGKTLSAVTTAMAAVDMPGEVIVVDNNSSDATARIAEDFGAMVVFEPVNQISRARNAGANKARGRYLIFLDADTILTAVLLEIVLVKLAGQQCCGGGASVEFDFPVPWYARWLPPVWNRLARRCGFAAGCFVFCLREGFDAVGGFSQQVFASEEIWFSRQLARWGRCRQMVFEIIGQPSIVTSSRKMQDYPVRNLLSFCFVVLFPFAVRSRRLSRLWYYR